MSDPIRVAVSQRTLDSLPAPIPSGSRLVVIPSTGGCTDDATVSKVDVLWRRQWDRTAWVSSALGRLPALRWLHTDTAGVDRMPLDVLSAHSVVLTNGRGAHTPAVAEWAVAAILMASKNLDRTALESAQGTWAPHGDDLLLHGRTVCILGLGDIGQQVARVCAALGMRVVGVSRSGRRVADVLHVRSSAARWHKLVAESSVLVNCLPLTSETADLIDYSVMSALRPPALLINVGRGETVVEADLVAAVRSGVLHRVVVDTVRTEPPPADSPLWGDPRIVVSPHTSSMTNMTELRTRQLFFEELERYRGGAPLVNIIDLERGY